MSLKSYKNAYVHDPSPLHPLYHSGPALTALRLRLTQRVTTPHRSCLLAIPDPSVDVTMYLYAVLLHGLHLLVGTGLLVFK